MVWHHNGFILRGNNQCILQPVVGLQMVLVVSPLGPFGRHPIWLEAFAAHGSINKDGCGF